VARKLLHLVGGIQVSVDSAGSGLTTALGGLSPLTLCRLLEVRARWLRQVACEPLAIAFFLTETSAFPQHDPRVHEDSTYQPEASLTFWQLRAIWELRALGLPEVARVASAISAPGSVARAASAMSAVSASGFVALIA
jgi:hypothetical protein